MGRRRGLKQKRRGNSGGSFMPGEKKNNKNKRWFGKKGLNWQSNGPAGVNRRSTVWEL